MGVKAWQITSPRSQGEPQRGLAKFYYEAGLCVGSGRTEALRSRSIGATPASGAASLPTSLYPLSMVDDDVDAIEAGDTVRGAGDVVRVPMGPALLGRVASVLPGARHNLLQPSRMRIDPDQCDVGGLSSMVFRISATSPLGTRQGERHGQRFRADRQ